MNGQLGAPPLRAWLLALVLALPIPWPLVAPMMNVPPEWLAGPNEYFYRHQLSDFLEENQRDRDRPRGVMLAMSGGSCATVGPRRLSTDGVDLYVAFYHDADLASFRGLVDVLMHGRPDFVVIQDTVLVLTRTSTRARELYRQARWYWWSRLQNLAHRPAAPEADWQADIKWRCGGWPRPRSLWASDVAKGMGRIRPYSEQRHSEVLDFVQRLARVGIPLLIASPPANNESAAYVSRMHEAARKLAHAQPPVPTVSFHQQMSLMPSELFPDPFHLLPSANQPYREWLNKEVLRVVEDKADQ